MPIKEIVFSELRPSEVIWEYWNEVILIEENAILFEIAYEGIA